MRKARCQTTPIHPGLVLQDELNELGIRQATLAEHIGVRQIDAAAHLNISAG
jgi:plasmid maintenance system antidote protein VapI